MERHHRWSRPSPREAPRREQRPRRSPPLVTTRDLALGAGRWHFFSRVAQLGTTRSALSRTGGHSPSPGIRCVPGACIPADRCARWPVDTQQLAGPTPRAMSKSPGSQPASRSPARRRRAAHGGSKHLTADLTSRVTTAPAAAAPPPPTTQVPLARLIGCSSDLSDRHANDSDSAHEADHLLD